MRGLLKDRGIKRIFILGAGFSAPLGMPLVAGVLKATYDIAKKKSRLSETTSYSQADLLLEKLRYFYPSQGFTHSMIEDGVTPEGFNIENFLAYVSATSAYGDDWSDGDDKFCSFLKAWVAEAIFKAQQESLQNICSSDQIPSQYSLLVDYLEGALVITFNWDTIVEYMMTLKAYPYVCNVNPWQSIADMNNPDYTHYRVPIFKLHGSIDWSSSSSSSKEEKNWEDLTPDQSKEKIFRVHDLENYYRNLNKNYLAVPKIVIPGRDKLHQVMKLGSLWESPQGYFSDDLEIIIIGFSMSEDDLHVRAFIYPELVQGSKEGSLKIKVIDLAKNHNQKENIQARYQGVENCQFWFDGFNEDVCQFIIR